MSTLTEKEKAEHFYENYKKYQRNYRRKNPQKVAAWNLKYYTNKAKSLENVKQG